MSKEIPAILQTEQRRLSPLEMSVPGRTGISLPEQTVPEQELPPDHLLRDNLDGLPEMSQLQTVRYYKRLEDRVFSVESGPYLLGSCSMKFNPRLNEAIARMPGFANSHPDQPIEQIQGSLQIVHELQDWFADLAGLDATTTVPLAGAHGEYTGMLMVRKHFEAIGELDRRRKVIAPDSAHGTNPASAARAGFEVVTIPSDQDGNVDLKALEAALGPDVACLMITQPNTLGLFDPNIREITAMVHANGGYVYGDGANFNALVGRVRPGDLGIDIMHINTHKTFSTPHGGGGPGAGPVCVREVFRPYLPDPVVKYDPEKDQYYTDRPEQTIGRISGGYGNFGVLLRAHAYIRSLGAAGLRAISDAAVLNANYLQTLLQPDFDIPYGNRHCMHEFVISLQGLKKVTGVDATDFSKLMLDFGYHAPTMHFPLIVEQALMVEPTESEAREDLDKLAADMRTIRQIAIDDPGIVKGAPYTTPVERVRDGQIARPPIRVHWPLPSTEAISET